MEVSKEDEELYFGLWCTIYAYICAVNVVAMITTACDKIKAENGEWRISEAVLYTLILLGGGPGALVAMVLCWHKVKKPSFWCCYIISVTPSAVGYGFLIACQTGSFGGEFCEVKLM